MSGKSRCARYISKQKRKLAHHPVLFKIIGFANVFPPSMLATRVKKKISGNPSTICGIFASTNSAGPDSNCPNSRYYHSLSGCSALSNRQLSTVESLRYRQIGQVHHLLTGFHFGCNHVHVDRQLSNSHQY